MRGGSSLGLPVADCLPDWLAGIAPSHTPLADSRLIRGAGLLDMLKPQYCCHLRGIFLRPTSMILIFNTPGESPADGENVQVSPLIMNASLVSLPSSPGVGCRVGGTAARRRRWRLFLSLSLLLRRRNPTYFFFLLLLLSSSAGAAAVVDRATYFSG